MAAATGSERSAKEKVVFCQDGVFVHTAVPSTTHSANIIPGRVTIIEKDHSTFVDWSPCGYGEDEFELQSSDYSEWNLITQSKQTEALAQEKIETKKSKYAIYFDIRELNSIRRSDPKLAWSYVVFILKDSNTLPALHFHSGGIQAMIRTLQRYVWLTRSPTNHKLFVVDDEHKALKKSLDQLQIFNDETVPVSSYFSRMVNTAYYDGMDALSKVTRYFRDTMDVIQAGPDMDFHSPAIGPAAQYKKDAEFEDLGEVTCVTREAGMDRTIPARRDLGEAPEVSREEPLNQDEWRTMLDKAGRVINIKRLHDRIFRGGVSSDLRKEVWRFLLGHYKYGCTFESRQTLCRAREEEYKTMKWQWQSVSAKQERRFAEFRERKQLVDKDVIRTDRKHPYYEASEIENDNVRKLFDVLMTYCMYNFDLGYVQGMSDLLSPILFIMDNEVDAFWCFVGLMEKTAHNFDENQEGMKMQLHQLTVLLQFVDPGFYDYLDKHDSGNLYFCFRWLLISFKREFSFDDIMTLWEAMWTQNMSPNYHLIICLAILDKHRQVIMEMDFGFNEILKYVNDLAYQIDVKETLIRAETLCLQLMTLSDLPGEVRAIVTGRNAAVMTPDVERPDPFLMLMRHPNVTRLLPVEEEQTSTTHAQSNGVDTADLSLSQSVLNDLSIIERSEAGQDSPSRSSPPRTSNGTPLNVQDPASDDEIIVLSEGAENIF